MYQGSQKPEIVHDAAAILFWTLADSVGIAEANEAVIDSAGQCLLEQPFTAKVLGQYSLNNLTRNDLQEFHSAVAAEAERYALNEQNMNGLVYGEDAQSGRSPSAQQVNTSLLKAIPTYINTVGAKIDKRKHLPAPSIACSRLLGYDAAR